MSACKFCGVDLNTISAPLGQLDHVQACELTELRALRDFLLTIRKAPNDSIYFDDVLALIARAKELAKP